MSRRQWLLLSISESSAQSQQKQPPHNCSQPSLVLAAASRPNSLASSFNHLKDLPAKLFLAGSSLPGGAAATYLADYASAQSAISWNLTTTMTAKLLETDPSLDPLLLLRSWILLSLNAIPITTTTTTTDRNACKCDRKEKERKLDQSAELILLAQCAHTNKI